MSFLCLLKIIWASQRVHIPQKTGQQYVYYRLSMLIASFGGADFFLLFF
jgi:hypothetical protein